jgi:hypothetical protein
VTPLNCAYSSVSVNLTAAVDGLRAELEAAAAEAEAARSAAAKAEADMEDLAGAFQVQSAQRQTRALSGPDAATLTAASSRTDPSLL